MPNLFTQPDLRQLHAWGITDAHAPVADADWQRLAMQYRQDADAAEADRKEMQAMHQQLMRAYQHLLRAYQDLEAEPLLGRLLRRVWRRMRRLGR